MHFYKKISNLWCPFTKSGIHLYASAAAFHLAMAVPPAISLIISLLPYFPGTQIPFLSLLNDTVPPPFQPILNEILEQIYNSGHPAVSSFSAIITLWSASKGILAIADGINAAMNAQRRSGYIRRRLTAAGYFLILTSSLMLSLVFLVLGNSALRRIFPPLNNKNLTFFRLAYPNFTLPFIMLTTLFTLMYRFLPDKKLPWKLSIFSAIPAAAGWLLFSWLFSFYISRISSFRRIYGGIGLIVLAGFWLHICMCILLYCGLYADLKHSKEYNPWRIIRSAFTNS